MSQLRLRPLTVVAALFALVWAGTASASPNGVVISEFRFTGPSGGNDEFVELLNTTSSAVPIGGYRLEGCAAASGAASLRVAVPAGVSLPAGGHYLFVNSTPTTGYSGTAPGDASYTTGLSDTGGARITTPAGVVIDGVGSSDGATDVCREGVGLVLTGMGDRSFERRSAGAQDTDDNVADFVGPKAGNPQGLGSAPPPPPPPTVEIAQIQGAAHRSPLLGQRVTTQGVVTAERLNGFWIQDPTPDADERTSEAVFVFTSPTSVAPGAAVNVTATVSEFRPGGASGTGLSITQL
nr:lamin tail domain-containing protein [Actinomycetota bacterium]